MTRKLIYFGQFCLDSSNAALTSDRDVVSLTPKAHSLLQYLVEHAGQLAPKDEIFNHVWANRVVTDAALTVCVRELRAALRDDARNPRYIETVSKRGYRFVAQIRSEPEIIRSNHSSEEPTSPERDRLVQPFVGRKDELSQLNCCEASANKGNRQFVFVTGEPGIGKTTLIEAFLKRSSMTESTWIARGQCIEQYGAGEAYLPILDSLGNLSKANSKSLFNILEKHAPTLLSQLPALTAEHGGDNSLPNARPERLLREITDSLEVIAEHRLLIVVLEDLHWSDLPTIELLSFLARRDSPVKLLVIASFRPADAIISKHPVKQVSDDLQRRQCCISIQLECLTEQQVTSYLQKLYPEHIFPVDFSSKVRQKSDGNPLFMVNLLAYLQRVKLLNNENDLWQLRSDSTEIDQCVSDDIHIIVNQQIEQLKPDLQAILEAASAASEPSGLASEFTLAEVAAVLQLPELEIEKDLDWLARNNIFILSHGITDWPDGSLSSSYGFTHALYQNVLYDRLNTLHKIQYHRRLSERLEQGFGSRHETIAGKLAVHFELGRQYSKAVSYLTSMAEIANSRGANREATLALERAWDLLNKIESSEEKDRLEVGVLLMQASSVTASQGNATPSIETSYLRALQLCEKIGDQSGRFRSMFGLRSFYVISGELDKAHDIALTLLSVATSLGDTALILEAHVGLANSEFFVGNHEGCHAHVLKGIELYDPQEHGGHALMYGLDPGVFCYAMASQTAWFLGLPDQALAFIRQSVELAETRQHPYSHVLAIHVQTQIYLYLGHTTRAIESSQRGKQLAAEHGFSFLYAWALYFSAWALAQDGQDQAALDEIDCARNAPRPKSLFIDSYLSAFMAEAYLDLGLAQEGLACLASPTLGQSYDSEREYLKSRFTALLATSSSSIEQAIRVIQKSLAVCRQQGAKIYELKTAICLAEIYIQQSEHRLALNCLWPLVTTFKEGLDSADIAQAKELVVNLEKTLKKPVLT